MSPMRQTRHQATCSVLMPDCTSTGPLQMEARYCPQVAAIHIRTGRKEEKKHQEKGMHSNQCCQWRSDRQESKGLNYINPWWIWLLGDESWHRETAGFSKHHPHRTETRYSGLQMTGNWWWWSWRSPGRQDVRKPMNGRWPSTLNYKNSAEVVVGVSGCFPWR